MGDTEEESIMNLFYTLLFYNFVMQMKFSLGNIIYFNNVSNSYINDCILRMIML